MTEFVAATEIEKKHHPRVFEVSDELASRSLHDWSEWVQLRLLVREDGKYDLVARTAGPPESASHFSVTGPVDKGGNDGD